MFDSIRRGVQLLCVAFFFCWQLVGQPSRTSSAAGAKSTQAVIDEQILKADRLRKEGKNDEALKILNQVLWLDSDCGQCFAFRSGVLGNLGRFRDGLADGFTGEQRSKTPRDKAFAAYNKGFNLNGLNRNSEALSAYEDCIRYDATFPMCYYGKGKTLNGMRDYARALTALEQATNLLPTHGPSHAYKAIAEAALGMANTSLTDGSLAVQYAPTDARSYLARAQAWGANKRWAEMLDDAKKALDLDPKGGGYHFLSGQALQGLGRNEDAAREFDLEPDRQAVAKYLHPEQNLDLRLYNCGDSSTDIQTPDNFNVDGFNDCKERVTKALMDSAVPVAPRPAPKRSIPGLPQRKANNK